ncbi:MAG: hypothetical protein ACI81L_002780 [Verrucomicrobiales bacterium]|jgi:hypothetical protein
MKRFLLAACGVLLAACGGGQSTGAQPESLALADSVDSSSAAESNVMRFEIDGEPFELAAGICNTYEDGSFNFALAEGPLGTSGRVTATIERFDTGVGFELIVALEGLRDDASSVTWYAQEPVSVHELDATVFGGTVQGTAVFDTLGGPDTPGDKADGSFSVTCTP